MDENIDPALKTFRKEFLSYWNKKTNLDTLGTNIKIGVALSAFIVFLMQA